MATFTYDAKDQSGKSISGLIEAAEPRGAASALREQGLWPTRIELAPVAAGARAGAMAPSKGGPSGAVPLFGNGASYPGERMGAQSRIDAAPFLVGVPLSDLAMMFRQMATLLNAGVPFVEALSTLGVQTSNGRLKGILRECASAVASGNPLSSVMVRYPNVFTGIQIEMIRAGETSGMLETMCNRIADYLEREIEIRRKLKRETLYPKIVLAVAWLVGGILIFVKTMHNSSNGTVGYVKFTAIVLFTVAIAWWLSRFLNQFPAFGAAWDYVKMLIPGPGGVARKYATARFTRALGTLYAGGVLLPNAVAIAARACGNRAIGQRILDNVGALHAGHGISGMLASTGLLSPIAVQMARTGEQTGNLDGMMDKVADYLESEADVKSHQLAVLSGVGALLFAAIVVGFIAISAYSGYFTEIMKQGDSG